VLKLKQWEKSTTGIWKYYLTNDLVCVVSWNLIKRKITKRGNNKSNNLHQLQGSSDNQYKYKAHIYQGDESKKYFYSDNLELIKKLILNHARNLIKQRIKEYQRILEQK
jgi:hypothetical protein